MGKISTFLGTIFVLVVLSGLTLSTVQVTAEDDEDYYGLCKENNISIGNCSVKFNSSMTYPAYSTGSGLMYKSDNMLPGMNTRQLTNSLLCSRSEVKCEVRVNSLNNWFSLGKDKYMVEVRKKGEVVRTYSP